MGLLTIIKKQKLKDKEIRILVLYVVNYIWLILNSFPITNKRIIYYDLLINYIGVLIALEKQQ